MCIPIYRPAEKLAGRFRKRAQLGRAGFPLGWTIPAGGRDTGRAMSQENVETARRFIEATRSGEGPWTEAFVAVSDPSIEHIRLPAASGPEMYSGHDGLRRWFADMAA